MRPSSPPSVRRQARAGSRLTVSGGARCTSIPLQRAARAVHHRRRRSDRGIEAEVRRNLEQYDEGPLQTDEKGIATIDSNKIAFVKDPDGNILAVAQA